MVDIVIEMKKVTKDDGENNDDDIDDIDDDDDEFVGDIPDEDSVLLVQFQGPHKSHKTKMVKSFSIQKV